MGADLITLSRQAEWEKDTRPSRLVALKIGLTRLCQSAKDVEALGGHRDSRCVARQRHCRAVLEGRVPIEMGELHELQTHRRGGEIENPRLPASLQSACEPLPTCCPGETKKLVWR